MNAKNLLVTGVICTILISTFVYLKKPQNIANTDLTSQKPTIMGWIYPGSPCTVESEITDGRKIDVLKPQYFDTKDNGDLRLLNSDIFDCNGYSEKFNKILKSNSSQTLFLVDAQKKGFKSLMASPEKQQASFDQILQTIDDSGFDGVELDFESFEDWTPTEYQTYLDYIKTLGDKLHTKNKLLSIDLPAIPDAQFQKLYKVNYADFNDLPIDYLVIMAYDFQYSRPLGGAVSRLTEIQDSLNNAKQKFKKTDQIVVGISNYGYYGTAGSKKFNTVLSEKIKQKFDTTKAQRDSESAELYGSEGDQNYRICDTICLETKLKAAQETGINKISIWHLGGEDWLKQ
jgi:spore germination protein YaaH